MNIQERIHETLFCGATAVGHTLSYTANIMTMMNVGSMTVMESAVEEVQKIIVTVVNLLFAEAC